MRAVIFDMDGVLIDSEPFWADAERAVFTPLGARVTPEKAERTRLMGTREVTEFWYCQNPWTGPSLVEVEAQVVSLVAKFVAQHGKLKCGAVECLQMIGKKGLKIGVASNSPKSLITGTLRSLGIEELFQAVASSEEVEEVKPNPAVFLLAAERLGVDPNDCLVIEDSSRGVLAARNAGMATVLLSPSPTSNDPAPEYADYWVTALSKLGSIGAFEMISSNLNWEN